MAYQGISHARSHRVPFAGLGRAPGYMGNYCGEYGLSGATSASSSGGGAAAAGGGGAAAWASAVAEGFKTTSTIIDAAAGGYQKRERESRRNVQIAQLTAQAAAGNAAAQVEIARLQAEAAVESARLAGQAGDASTKRLMMIGGGIAILAVLGIGAAIVFKK